MQTFRVYLIKRRGHSDFCEVKRVICVFAFNFLVSVTGPTSGDSYDLILAVRSQIFEYFRGTFRRRTLEYLQLARLEKKKRKKTAVFLRNRLTLTRIVLF